MSRLKAFLIHFSLSFLVVSTCLLIIVVAWYPGFYFHVFAATEVLKVLIGVDLVLGPLLTLILFKPGKWGLYFDLTVVAMLQIAALTYGLHVIYQERPYFTVFAVDRFEVITQQDVDMETVDRELLQSKSWSEPILVVAEIPADPEARNQLMHETLFEGKPDIQQRPELWRPYMEVAAEVINQAQPVAQLISRDPGVAKVIESFASADQDSSSFVYLPIMGKHEIYSLVMDPLTRKPLGLVDLDPWGDDAESNADSTAQVEEGQMARNAL